MKKLRGIKFDLRHKLFKLSFISDEKLDEYNEMCGQVYGSNFLYNFTSNIFKDFFNNFIVNVL